MELNKIITFFFLVLSKLNVW